MSIACKITHFIACKRNKMLWFLLMNLKEYQLNCATGNSRGDWSRASLRETSGVAWMNILGI